MNWIVVPPLSVFVGSFSPSCVPVLSEWDTSTIVCERVLVKESGNLVAEGVRVGDCDGDADSDSECVSVSEGEIEKVIFSRVNDSENVRGQIPGQK